MAEALPTIMEAGYIVLARGPHDQSLYGTFTSFDAAYDWASKEWPEDSAVEFEVHIIWHPLSTSIKERI